MQTKLAKEREEASQEKLALQAQASEAQVCVIVTHRVTSPVQLVL